MADLLRLIDGLISFAPSTKSAHPIAALDNPASSLRVCVIALYAQAGSSSLASAPT